MRRRSTPLLLASLIALALPAAPPAAAAPNPAAAVTTIDIVGKTYAPNPSQVYVGTDVDWDNTTGRKHSATANGGLRVFFDTGAIAPGDTEGQVVGAVGTFPYHCTFHKGMKGKVQSILYTDAVPGSTAAPLGITLGTSQLPKGFRFQVQSRVDSSGPAWEIIAQGRQLVVQHQYTQAGNYDIRARVQNPKTGTTSKWSLIWNQPIS